MNKGFFFLLSYWFKSLCGRDVTSQSLMNVPVQNWCGSTGKHWPLLLVNVIIFKDGQYQSIRWCFPSNHLPFTIGSQLNTVKACHYSHPYMCYHEAIRCLIIQRRLSENGCWQEQRSPDGRAHSASSQSGYFLLDHNRQTGVTEAAVPSEL